MRLGVVGADGWRPASRGVAAAVNCLLPSRDAVRFGGKSFWGEFRGPCDGMWHLACGMWHAAMLSVFLTICARRALSLILCMLRCTRALSSLSWTCSQDLTFETVRGTENFPLLDSFYWELLRMYPAPAFTVKVGRTSLLCVRILHLGCWPFAFCAKQHGGHFSRSCPKGSLVSA